jgi:hypothetical protein
MSHADTLGAALKAAIETDVTGLSFDDSQLAVWEAFAHELLTATEKSTLLVFGARDIDATSIRYLYPAPISANSPASSSEMSLIVPFACEIRSISARHNRAGSSAEDVRYRIRLDDVNAGLWVDLATGSVSDATETGVVAVSAGDRLSVIASPFSPGVGPDTVYQPVVTVELVH